MKKGEGLALIAQYKVVHMGKKGNFLKAIFLIN